MYFYVEEQSNLFRERKSLLSCACVLFGSSYPLCLELECVLAAGNHCDKIILDAKTSKIQSKAQLVLFLLKAAVLCVFLALFKISN